MKTLYSLCIAIFSLIFCNTSAFAANRYWVSNGSNTDWNNTANWSNNSGGTTGYSVPGSNDIAIFDVNGNFNCNINVNVSVKGIKTIVGYTATINPNSYTIYVQGSEIDWRGGTMAAGTGSFTFDTPGEFSIQGGIFNVPAAGMTVNKIFKLLGGTFNGANAALSFSNNFHIDGGTFNASSGIMFLSGGSLNFDAPSSFVHNNGTIIINGTQSTGIQIGQGPNRKLSVYEFQVNKMTVNQNNFNLRDDDTLTVLNNLTIAAGQIQGLNSAIEITKDLVGGSAFVGSNTSFVFVGSADQSVILHADAVSAIDGDFCVNKPNTSKVILNSAVTMDKESSQKLMLIKGIVKTTTTNILTLDKNVDATGGSSNSYVDGPMQKAGKDGFTFPVGKAGYYAPIAISGNTNMGTNITATSTFRAEYFKQDPNSTYNVNQRDISLGSVSRCEYWMLDRVAGAGEVYVWLSFSSTRTCYVNSSAEGKRVSHWNGSKWEDKGNGNYSVAPFIRSTEKISSFSPFAVGSIDPSDIILPLLFSNFTTVLNGSTVKMNWNLYNDVINTGDHMYIQRSTDGKNWNTISEVRFEASKYDYQGADNAPVAGVNYYRVKIQETSGTVIYSPTRFIRTDKAANVVSLSPNPAVNDFRVMLAKPYGTGEMQIFNLNGKKVYAENISGKQVIPVNTATYAPGVYVLILAGDGEKVQQKFIVQK